MGFFLCWDQILGDGSFLGYCMVQFKRNVTRAMGSGAFLGIGKERKFASENWAGKSRRILEWRNSQETFNTEGRRKTMHRKKLRPFVFPRCKREIRREIMEGVLRNANLAKCPSDINVNPPSIVEKGALYVPCSSYKGGAFFHLELIRSTNF